MADQDREPQSSDVQAAASDPHQEPAAPPVKPPEAGAHDQVEVEVEGDSVEDRLDQLEADMRRVKAKLHHM